MKRNRIKFISLALFLCAAPLGAAEPDGGSPEKVYREYTEAYKKAAQSYERAAQESQSSGYVTWTVLGAFMAFIVILAAKTRRSQKAYTDKALEISLANQKLLEEIRDLLKK